MFNAYEKKINEVTKKYENVLAEQVAARSIDVASKKTPEERLEAAFQKSSKGLAVVANKSSSSSQKQAHVLSISDLEAISNSLVKTGINNINPNKLATIRKWAEISLDNKTDPSQAESMIPPWTLVGQGRAGKLQKDWWKAATQLTKIILDFKGTATLGGVETFNIAGLSYAQLTKALNDAKKNDISLVAQLEQIKGSKVTNEELAEIFNFAGDEFETYSDTLAKLDNKLLDQVEIIKTKYKNMGNDYPQEFRRTLRNLSFYDGFRSGPTSPAYKELYNWTQKNYVPQVSKIIPTVNALGRIAIELSQYENEWLISQATKEALRKLDAYVRWKDAVSIDIANKIRLAELQRERVAGEELASRDEIRQRAKDSADRTRAARQETEIRDAIRQAAQDAADRKRAGEEELANRNFIRDEAARIAREKQLAAEQEKAIRDEIRQRAKDAGEEMARTRAASQELSIRDEIRQAAEEAADRKRAGEEELANRNFIRDEAARIARENQLAAEQEKAIRDEIRQAAREAADRTRAGREELANRDVVRATAARIAKERQLAAEQELAIRDAIREAAQEAADRKRAGEEELANRNFIRDEAARIAKENRLAAQQEKAIRDAIREAAVEAGEEMARTRAGGEELANRDEIRQRAQAAGKLAKIKRGYEQFSAADAESMEKFYEEIPELLWREVDRVVNFQDGYSDDPTGMFPRWQGVVRVQNPRLESINDKVGNYIRKGKSDKLDFFNNFGNIFRDKDLFTEYVLSPDKREEAIFKLQDLYVNIKSIDDLVKLQEDSRPVKIKFPNVPEISLTTKDDDGVTVAWTEFDVNSVINLNNIKSAMNWFAEKLPNRISAYDQRAETSIGRAITNIDFEALDQKAQSQAEQMLESIERGRSAGEEEFANREQIRQRAEDSVMQDKLKAAHQAASALAVQSQFDLENQEISRQVEQEKITVQTIETLDLIISAINVATNDVDNRSVKDIYEVVNYITLVFRSLSGDYYEDSRISSKFNQIEDDFQNLLRAKVASVDTELDQALDLAQVELGKEDRRDISEDVVSQLLNIVQESNVKGLADAYPRGFTDFTLNTDSVDSKLRQLAANIIELNNRLDRNKDPFFILWYEITEDMADLIDRIKDLDLDDIVPVVEKLDELESLIDDENMQLNYDKKLDNFETVVDTTITHKLNDAVAIFNDLRSNLVDADGNLKPQEEFVYEDFESYVDLWELWQAIGEIYDAVDLEPSQFYKDVAKKIAAITRNIPIDKMPFSGRSRDDFMDWVVKYGPKGSGRGDGEAEASRREEYKLNAVDENGFPLYNDAGDYLSTEKQRNIAVRKKAINSSPAEVRQMLKARREAHHANFQQYVDKPGKDPYIKLLVQAMRYNDEDYERYEIFNAELGTLYNRNKELIKYLDTRISPEGEYDYDGNFFKWQGITVRDN